MRRFPPPSKVVEHDFLGSMRLKSDYAKAQAVPERQESPHDA